MKTGTRIATLVVAASLFAPASAVAAPDDVTIVSRANGAGGAVANAESIESSISANGCRVAFSSQGTNLATVDPGASFNIFVRDICAGTTELVSKSTGGTPGNGSSFNPAISNDGEFVAFRSNASNLGEVGPDTASDVFLRDLGGGTTTLITVNDAGTDSIGGFDPGVSTDGGPGGVRVVFQSTAPAEDFISGPANPDTNGQFDIFMRSFRGGAQTGLVSHTAAATPTAGNGQFLHPTISDTNGTVAFESTSSDLAAGDPGADKNVFALQFGGAVSLVSRTAAGVAMPADTARVSGDGFRVGFEANAMVPDDTTLTGDAYLKNIVSGAIQLVSRQSGTLGDVARFETDRSVPSGDGRFVAFNSDDPDVAEGAAHAGSDPSDLFIRDTLNQTTFLASRAPGALGPGADGPSIRHDFASNGQFVTFSTPAGNLGRASFPDNQIFRREIAEPGVPVQGRSVNVRPLAGTTLIRQPGQKKFSTLTASSKIPIGSVIDVRKGRVELTSIHSGILESIKFFDGIFRVKQKTSGDPFLNAQLTDPSCLRKKGKGKKGGGKGKKKARAAAGGAANSLWAKGKGRYRTTGGRGSATVRGTEWLTVNRCNGATFFKVVSGSVAIDDFGKRKAVNKVIKGPNGRYVAKAGKSSKKKKKK